MEYEAEERPSADETRAWLEVGFFFVKFSSGIQKQGSTLDGYTSRTIGIPFRPYRTTIK